MKEKITRTSVCDDEEGIFLDHVVASKYNRYNTLNTAAEVLELFFLKIQGSPSRPKGKKLLATTLYVLPTYVQLQRPTVWYVHRIFRVTCVEIFFFHSLFIFFFSSVSWLWNKIRVLIESEPVVYLRYLESSQVNHSSRTVDWRRPQTARPIACAFAAPHRRRLAAVDVVRTQYNCRWVNTHSVHMSYCEDGSCIPWSVACPCTRLLTQNFVEYKKSQSSRLQKRVLLFFLFLHFR